MMGYEASPACNGEIEIAMRLLLWTIFGIGTICTAAPAPAQTYDPNYPACIQISAREGGYIECNFVSMEQCRAAASGRAAYCIPNPYVPVRPRWRRR
jgi:Protein of unknown function (DUF3551)